MTEDLRGALSSAFGFDSFRPGQEEAIGHLLAGRHALVVMPTGAGKSLIYQLASLQLPGTTLVISPLISLMRDQVTGLNKKGIHSTLINSTVAPDKQVQRTRNMEAGRYRLVYVAPERLRSTQFMEALARTQISLLAVDEAHCISHWGHDFRPDYLQIGAARARIGNPTTAALTATATPAVQADIVRALGLQPCEKIITGFNRPNLTFLVRYAADEEAKLRALHGLLSERNSGSLIVYTGTRRETEELADFMTSAAGTKARPYHGGMESDARTEVQTDFMAGRLRTVAATNAFGMGIDRADVRMVIHHTVPGALEAYYQEAGRAGRDGEPAKAVLIYSPKDRALHEWFINQDSPGWDELSVVYGAAAAAARPEGWLAQEDISLRTGLHDVKVKLALAQLESAGMIQRLGDSGTRMLLRCNPWDEKALSEVDQAAAEHREHRLDQLSRMVSYAESGSCRRRILLAHFGDREPADAPSCCDNCIGKQATVYDYDDPTDEGHTIALIILDALDRASRDLGRSKLAQVLAGSRAADILQFGHNLNPNYGKLSGIPQSVIRNLADELISEGYIRMIGGTLPVLKLTPLGVTALRERRPISLALPERPLRPEGDAHRSVASYLSRAHPKPLAGPWEVGWALGFHSGFSGDQWARSKVGELAYRLKYRQDRSALKPLVELILSLMAEHRELADADVITPAPPSSAKEFDHVRALAEALGARLGIPVRSAISRTRETEPQKEMRSLAQKKANVAGAFDAADDVKDKRVLVLDDFYDSGATLEEISRVLRRAGAHRIAVLTLTRTIHTDA